MKEVKKLIREIKKLSISSKYVEKLLELSNKLNSYQIVSLTDFLCSRVYPGLSNGRLYRPSSGEKAMLILNEIVLEKKNNEIFVLDEPEMSVGNMFINDILIPTIRELANQNKKIFISTHDANIAIRTNPYVAIYREDCGDDCYKTFIGSSFYDEMTCLESKECIDYVITSMKVLEGGREAFDERGETYGKKGY